MQSLITVNKSINLRIAKKNSCVWIKCELIKKNSCAKKYFEWYSNWYWKHWQYDSRWRNQQHDSSNSWSSIHHGSECSRCFPCLPTNVQLWRSADDAPNATTHGQSLISLFISFLLLLLFISIWLFTFEGFPAGKRECGRII